MVLSKKSFWESEQKLKKNANVQIYKTWESQYVDMYLKQEIWSVIWISQHWTGLWQMEESEMVLLKAASKVRD